MSKYFYQRKTSIFGSFFDRYFAQYLGKFFPKIFNKYEYRRITNGTEEMLNSGDNPLVSFKNIDIIYGSGRQKNKVIHDLSFNIYDGEVLSFVGESGSGKSTTGSALAGLVSHHFGQIKIGDLILPQNKSDIRGQILTSLVKTVQMIFQDPLSSLNPYKNIYTVVTEGIDNLEIKNKGAIKNIFFQNFLESTFYQISRILKQNSSLDQQQASYLKQSFSQKIATSIEEGSKFLFSELANFLQEQNALDLEIKTLLEEKHKEFIANQDKSTSKLKRQLVVELLASVGLDESVLDRFPLEFSGGQQQRIGICRALLVRPKILIADEPISALDVSIQAQIINIFKDLKEKYNLTILFISHDLRMVEYISDRIAVVHRGRLLEIGPTQEIINNFLHPYTKSLIEAIPTIESNRESLVGYIYNPQVHNYTTENQPHWINLGNNHFILATEEEVAKWQKGEY